MPAWIRHSALRLVIALAMAIGLVLSPISVAVSHGPAMLGSHGPLFAVPDDGHGHSHDDDGPTNREAGHAHHNPADHSHDQPDRATYAALTAPSLRQNWWAAAPSAAEPQAPARLDRPPRPFLAA